MPIHCRSHESWGTDYQHVGDRHRWRLRLLPVDKRDWWLSRFDTKPLWENLNWFDLWNFFGCVMCVQLLFSLGLSQWSSQYDPCTRNRSRVMPFALPFSSIPGVKVWMVLGAIVVSLGEGIQILVYKVVNRLISQISHTLHQTFNVCMYIYIVLAAEIDVVIYFSSCAWFSIIRFTRKSYNTTPAYALLIYSECRYANICHVFVGSSKRENVRDTHLRTGRLVGSKL